MIDLQPRIVEPNVIKSYFTHIFFPSVDDVKELDLSGFHKLLKLPKFVAIKLFTILDVNMTGRISIRNLTEKMFIFFYDRNKEKIRLMFDLFDFDSDEVVNIEDISLILYHLSIRSSISKFKLIKQMIEDSFNNQTTLNWTEFDRMLQKENSDILWLFNHLIEALCPLTDQCLDLYSQYIQSQPELRVIGNPLIPPSNLLMQITSNNYEEEYEDINSLMQIEKDFKQLTVHLDNLLKNKLTLKSKNYEEKQSLSTHCSMSLSSGSKVYTEIIVYKANTLGAMKFKLVLYFNQIFELEFNEKLERYFASRVFLNWEDVNVNINNDINDKNLLSHFFTIKTDIQKNIYYSYNIEDILFFCKEVKSLATFQKIPSKYSIGSLIKRSKNSEVFLGENLKTKEAVAIKKIKKTMVAKELNEWEIEIFQILRKVPHDYIADAVESLEDESNFYLIFKYYKKVNWNSIYFNDMELKQIITKITGALQHLATLGIVHRDIKEDNLLLVNRSSLDIRLIDFGFSQVLGKHEKIYEPYGTLLFSAPELLCYKPYSHSIDMWSLGVLLYYLKFKIFPFDDQSYNAERIRLKILQADYYYPKNNNDLVKGVIVNCLTRNPQKRLSITEIYSMIYNN